MQYTSIGTKYLQLTLAFQVDEQNSSVEIWKRFFPMQTLLHSEKFHAQNAWYIFKKEAIW